ncbi:hypothetical protein ACB316_16530 [Aeromonas sanarellii]
MNQTWHKIMMASAALAAVALAACGQNAATAENASATDTTTSAADAAAVTETANTTAANEAAPPAVADAAPAKVQTVAAQTVTALPLKRGYYVASDTPCGQASNATTTLLRRDGIGGARDFCAFKKIEQMGPNTYRVTEACGDLQDNAPPETSVNTYTLKGDTGFTSKSESGWEHSARYCVQSSMPPDWRENDISDVTG